MATLEQPLVPFLDESPDTEFGPILPRASIAAAQTSLIIASYNIRYAVGPHLVSSGLLRRVGLNPPQPRAKKVAHNIQTATRGFDDGTLLPPVHLPTLRPAPKRTGRAGGHHVGL